MKNVLLPTDFSDNADNAAAYATELLRAEPCTFYFLNTYTPAIAHSRFMAETSPGTHLAENEGKTSELGLQKTIDNVRSLAQNSEHRFEAISSFDLLTHKITETVASKNIDLIVSGTLGASGLKQTFLGTNTVRMIKAIKNCPIITVPKKYTFTRPKHIAFPTDFKHNFSADVLDPLLKIAKQFDAEIHIMHINVDDKKDRFQESNRYTLMQYMAPVAHHVHFMQYYTSKSAVIETFLEELQIDMLALVYNEHGFLAQIMREQVVSNMAFHGNIPLLVLPS
jgi:nucleotide-binding universal stress UspA family protein